MAIRDDAVRRVIAPAAVDRALRDDPGTLLGRLFGAIGGATGRDADQPTAAATNETSYRAFLEAIGVAVYTTDADGRITFFNEAAVDLWGRRPELGEEWCGSLRLFELDGTPMAHGDCPMAIALKENRPVRCATALAERPDGRRVAFTPYPTPLRAPDGRLVGAVNVLVDVSERVEAEASLMSAAAALEASNAVKDEFLGLMSHELRTPVTSIYGNAILLDRLSLPAAASEMVRDIGEDADRLLRIVENLLQLTRLGSGADIEREPQVLNHIVSATVDSYRRRHPDREVRLAADRPWSLVDADGTSLELLLENLLSNADKYSPPDAAIDVTVRTEDERAVVHVLDRGIGIGVEDAAHVFTTFFRSEAARRAAGGVGVGLAVCRRIVEAHDGTIWAGPRDGGGADVGFALPIRPDVDT